MSKIRKILRVGFINTLRINLHYFGMGGVLHPIILCGKHVRLSLLSGTVKTDNKSIGAIQIGIGYNGVVDGKSNRCTWENNGSLYFKGKCVLNVGSNLINYGTIVLGDDVSFNGKVNLICYDRIEIGNHFICAWNCQIMDTDFHKIYDKKTGTRINNNEPIIIGDDVWIGTGAIILKGSNIASNCVVAAGSVVTKKLCESNSIYVSNNTVRTDIVWES